ncbi:MAG: hypothetical protein VB050_13045 [Geobacteraceae bacterium]|nr:hypothetical protein [Geobacteraceae bacterium]
MCPKSHSSARYELSIGKHTEAQSSSGIIVSTGLGSTGWFRSILAGARGIAAHVGNKIAPTTNSRQDSFAWEADYLYFSVREPWPSKTSSAETTFGKVTRKKPLRLTSQMPENGVLFSDGIENDFVEFNSGTSAMITVAEKKGCLVA